VSLASWGPWLALIGGLALGSFFNVCIHRLPRGESLAWPGSRCPACGHALSWFENIPIVSYLALRGRCSACRAPISVRYPIVELTTGLFFVAAALTFEPGWLLASRLVFGSMLIVLFAIDLEHHLLPNAITLPGIVVGLAFSLVTEPGIRSALIGAIGGYGVLWLLSATYRLVRGHDGMGMGDLKMLAMIGAFLGWKLMLMTLMLSSVLGSIVGLGVVVTGRGGLKYELPYGTFLAVAAFLACIVGDAFISWYVESIEDILTFYLS
jgi:leader peptidase (prepilin peptidase)/N-methyltransferase